MKEAHAFPRLQPGCNGRVELAAPVACRAEGGGAVKRADFHRFKGGLMRISPFFHFNNAADVTCGRRAPVECSILHGAFAEHRRTFSWRVSSAINTILCALTPAQKRCQARAPAGFETCLQPNAQTHSKPMSDHTRFVSANFQINGSGACPLPAHILHYAVVPKINCGCSRKIQAEAAEMCARRHHLLPPDSSDDDAANSAS